MGNELAGYADLLSEVKQRIRHAQTRAVLSANREMLALYWDIGRIIIERQEVEGWGAGVLRTLAQDLKSEIPSIKGFSERNLKRMTQFYREYPGLAEIGPPLVAQFNEKPVSDKEGPPAVAQKAASGDPSETVQRLVVRLPWAHNILLIQKIKDLPTRLWYMQQTIEQGWSRNVLQMMSENNATRISTQECPCVCVPFKKDEMMKLPDWFSGYLVELRRLTA